MKPLVDGRSDSDYVDEESLRGMLQEREDDPRDWSRLILNGKEALRIGAQKLARVDVKSLGIAKKLRFDSDHTSRTRNKEASMSNIASTSCSLR
ncbi:hypothetical protein HAX54_048034 [Datura stramonium]|uniref:Uncharacterized protein n=1 Tax=Datura stramonium TaxID=4076 RepID=A0ABS8SV23_DATST|nr:hypothetical protein [Datura stramonium]